jgi:hypothetical protein
VDRVGQLEGDRGRRGEKTQEKFLSLRDVRLTEMTLTSSEGVAELAVRNPFSFPLKIAETEYTLSAEGREVGGGAREGMILHPTQNNVLSLPVEIDHGALLSGRREGALSGGDVRVELERHARRPDEGRRHPGPAAPDRASDGRVVTGGFERLRFSLEGRVARVTLARPEVRNAFDDALISS